VAARSLQHVHAIVDADLRAQVAQIARELDQQTDATIKAAPWIDWALLRGVPLIGGPIVGEVIPGSEEHVEQLSA
jgi:hypothetical protein